MNTILQPNPKDAPTEALKNEGGLDNEAQNPDAVDDSQ